jgi:hypothetical protein
VTGTGTDRISFRENDNDQYSYRSLEAEVVQMIPLMRANWVIALRGLTTITDMCGFFLLLGTASLMLPLLTAT